MRRSSRDRHRERRPVDREDRIAYARGSINHVERRYRGCLWRRAVFTTAHPPSTPSILVNERACRDPVSRLDIRHPHDSVRNGRSPSFSLLALSSLSSLGHLTQPMTLLRLISTQWRRVCYICIRFDTRNVHASVFSHDSRSSEGRAAGKALCLVQVLPAASTARERDSSAWRTA